MMSNACCLPSLQPKQSAMSVTGICPRQPLDCKIFNLFKDKCPNRECHKLKGDVEEASAAEEGMDDGRYREQR